MADLFATLDDDPLEDLERDLYRDPFKSLLSPRKKRRKPLQDEISPEDKSSIFSDLAAGTMSGVATVGHILDKHTGSRLVRGVLGGKPREILSILPFSDTLGITDREDIVRGTDLIGAPKDTPLFSPEGALGFALEVGLDPTLPFTGWLKGSATAAGKGLKAAGLFEDAISATTKAAAKTGEKIGRRVAGLRGTTRKFLGELDAPARAAAETKLGTLSDEVLDMPLAGNLGYGIPFMDTIGTVNLPFGKKIAQAQDWLGETIRYGNIPGTKYSPGRHAGQLFDAASKSMGSTIMQKAAQGVHRAERGAEAAITEPGYRVADELVGMGPSKDELAELAELKMDPATDPDLVRAFEKQLDAKRYDPRALMRVAEGVETDPALIAKYQPYVDSMMAPQNASFARSQQLGAAGEELADPYIKNYFPRSALMEQVADNADLVKPAQTLGTEYGARKARGEHMRGWLRGSDTIEDVLDNPAIIGAETVEEISGILKSQHASLFPKHDDELLEGVAETIQGWKQSTKPTIDEATGAISRKPFWKDPAVAAVEKGKGRVRGEMHAKGIMEGLEGSLTAQKFKPLTPDELAEAKPLGEVLRMGSLLQGDGAKGAVQELAKRLGKPGFDHKTIDQMVAQGAITKSDADKAFKAWKKSITDLPVPKEIYRDVQRAQKLFDSPEEVEGIWKAVDSFLTLFKVGVLTHPAFHTRNIVGAKVADFTTGEFSGWSNAMTKEFIEGKPIDALKFPFVKQMLDKEGLAHTPENANKVFRSTMASIGIMNPRHGTHSQIAQTAGRGPQTLQALAAEIPGKKPMGIGPLLGGWGPLKETWKSGDWNLGGIRGFMGKEATTLKPLKVNEAVGSYIDAMTRLPPLMNQLARGVDLQEALGKVLASQVDYSRRSYTAFENNVMKRWLPFYAFSRKMGEYVLKELADKPSGRLAQVVRGQARLRDEEQFLPRHLRQGAAIPIPGAPEGFQRVISSLGLMHEDPLSFLQTGPTAFKTAQGFGQEVLGRTNPLFKAPLEIAAGKQLFSGRELQDLEGNVSQIAENITGQDVKAPILLEQAVSNSPLSRVATTVRTLTDARKGPFAKATNLLSGVRVSDADVEKTASIAQREIIEDLLRGRPGIKTLRPHLYADDLEKLTPEERNLMIVYRELGSNAQKAARLKKKAVAK